jgi:hypothetical protein
MVKKLGLCGILVFIFGIFTVGAQEASLVGIWVPESGQRISDDFIEKSLELLNNGTGIGDGYSLKWTAERDRLILRLDVGMGFAYKYQISGSTLILTSDNGVSVRYKQERNEQINSGASSPVGRWVPESGQRISDDFIEKRLELRNDGTGIGDGYSLKWTVERDRLILRLGVGMGFAYKYQISGSTLILTNDKGRSVRYKKE